MAALDPAVRTDDEEINRDLGFGSVVARESRQRLLNRDGSFNVRRKGMKSLASLSAYHHLLTISWPRFLALVVVSFMVVNAVFGLAFLACGPGALHGAPAADMGGNEFLRAFFFSVQTFATIGYGHVSPAGLAANLLVTVEALVGLLVFALATGLLFARFSRPTAKVVFSDRALIAPFQGATAFEFRIVNSRSNQLLEVECQVLFTRYSGKLGIRQFVPLALERRKVTFFPLSWTIVHAIDAASPLFGLSHQDLVDASAEFLVVVNGFDETFSQTVHTRSSYKPEEVVWGAAFKNMYQPPDAAGNLSIDVGLLSDFERVALPSPQPAVALPPPPVP
ncbi:MAG TPA: ion channel [Thermoanaerobaculia bacterium]|nr:ion channel [Thermoanaerobaculia bacterium]